MKKALLLLCACASLLIGSMSSSGHAAGGLAGIGSTSSHCDPPMVISVAGVETTPGSWAFDVAVLNLENTINDPFTFCDFVPALTLPFAGAWESAAGGCMPLVALDAVAGEMNLCLTSPEQVDDTTTRYHFNVCDHPVPECVETEDTIRLVGTTA